MRELELGPGPEGQRSWDRGPRPEDPSRPQRNNVLHNAWARGPGPEGLGRRALARGSGPEGLDQRALARGPGLEGLG